MSSIPRQSENSIRRRSRSPSPHYQKHKRRSHHRSPNGQHSHHSNPSSSRAVESFSTAFPFNARPLRKPDIAIYRPLFASYLEIQKQLALENLPEREVQGRWKSFVGKWNRRELAEGWYDPFVLRKAQEEHTLANAKAAKQRISEAPIALSRGTDLPASISEDDEDDHNGFGPRPPSNKDRHFQSTGPKSPTTQDLAYRRELSAEASQEVSTQARKDLARARRLDTLHQKHLLDEIAPRAAPGTRDRQLEKKREKADAVRAFAASKTDAVGGVEEVPDEELLGGGGDDDGGGIEGYKRRRKEVERKKTEMEIRREENARAKEAERQERRDAYRRREEEVMRGLVEVARARFG